MRKPTVWASNRIPTQLTASPERPLRGRHFDALDFRFWPGVARGCTNLMTGRPRPLSAPRERRLWAIGNSLFLIFGPQVGGNTVRQISYRFLWR
jgi:hypothetical protein